MGREPSMKIEDKYNWLRTELIHIQGDMYFMTWKLDNGDGLTMTKRAYEHYKDRVDTLLSLTDDIERHCKRRERSN